MVEVEGQAHTRFQGGQPLGPVGYRQPRRQQEFAQALALGRQALAIQGPQGRLIGEADDPLGIGGNDAQVRGVLQQGAQHALVAQLPAGIIERPPLIGDELPQQAQMGSLEVLEQVAAGENAHQAAAIVRHRQAAHPQGAHQGTGLMGGRVRVDAIDGLRHLAPDGRQPQIEGGPGQADGVAFGDDPQDPARRNDQHRTDAPLVHEAQGLG